MARKNILRDDRVKKLTSTFGYYYNYVITVIISFVLIGVGINAVISHSDSDNWPYFIVFIIVGLLMLYGLFNFRIVQFDNEYVYTSGWLLSAGIPFKNISEMEANPFLINPSLVRSRGYETYRIKYLDENGKNKKFYFVLDMAWSLNNWKQFKSQLPFKFENT